MLEPSGEQDPPTLSPGVAVWAPAVDLSPQRSLVTGLWVEGVEAASRAQTTMNMMEGLPEPLQ